MKKVHLIKYAKYALRCIAKLTLITCTKCYVKLTTMILKNSTEFDFWPDE